LYGTLEGVIAAAQARDAATRSSVHDKVLAAQDYLAVAPRVVQVALDVPLASTSHVLPTQPADLETLFELADRWNLRSSVNRVVAALAQR
jgi:hypothetical protein